MDGAASNESGFYNLYRHYFSPTCPFALQGEHPDLFIQYPKVKEIEPVDREPSTLLFSR